MGQIIYEMSGLPGSGKSTYVTIVCNKNVWLSNEELFYFDTFRARGSAFHSVYYILRGIDPLFDISFTLKYLFDRDVSHRGTAFKRIIKLFKLRGKIRTNSRYFLISEGLVQCFCEILDSMKSDLFTCKYYISDYFEKTINECKNLYFIIILSHPELSNNRIINRIGVNNSVDQMSEEQRIHFLIHREASIKYCVEIIKRTVKKNRYLIIDSTDQINRNSDLIENFIMSLK